MFTRTPVAAAFVALLPVARAGDVFVHYMIQGLNPGSGADDVNRAAELGFTGFALNVGQPGSAGDPWSPDAIAQLFAAAEATENSSFKLFFSMDLYSDSNPYDFVDLINNYTSSASYYRYGPDALPLISTFSNGEGTDPSYWPDWKSQIADGVYFWPNFDQVDDYYNDSESWLSKWGDVADGLFSWETSWPGQQDTPTNASISQDETVMAAAHGAGKPYMMPLSSLQYKHYDGNHWYRAGEVVLPQRMTEILSLAAASASGSDDSRRPELVQVQTWNDAGESHYIGELREEGLDDQILAYANASAWDHTGWQPLFASFNAAFRTTASNGTATDGASAMTPQDGSDVVGAMWYHQFLVESATCEAVGGKPEGSGAALDAINWATVVKPGLTTTTDLFVQVWSGGALIAHEPLGPGLNYGSVPGVVTGEQYVEVIDGDENIIISGKGGIDVTEEPASTVCNMNYQVAGLTS